MTVKELLTKLLEHYKFAIPQIFIMDDMLNLNVAYGICYCAEKELGINTYNTNWIETVKQQLQSKYVHWHRMPSTADTIAQAKELVQARIDTMQDILDGKFPAVDLELKID